MPRPSLTLASMSEAYVRITYQIIYLDWKHNPKVEGTPFDRLTALAQRLDDAGLHNYSFWIIAYRTELLTQSNCSACRRAMLRRSYNGDSFRKVAYGAYKANRRTLPPY